MTINVMFLQSDTAVTAQKQRTSQYSVGSKMFSTGTGSGTRIDGVGGVNPQPNALKVTQTGTPSLAVAVDRGACIVPGLESVIQGNYSVVNDAAIASVALATAPHATLYRKDAIVVRVKDTQYSGASNLGEIICVTGNTGASAGATSPPSAGTIGNSYIELGYVTVRPATSSILNSDIEDRRHWLSAPGGVTAIRTFETATPGIMDGDIRWNPATNQVEYWKSSDSLWHGTTPILFNTALASSTALTFGDTTVLTLAIPDPGWPYKLMTTFDWHGLSGSPLTFTVQAQLDSFGGTNLTGIAAYPAGSAGSDGIGGPPAASDLHLSKTGISAALTGAHNVLLTIDFLSGTGNTRSWNNGTELTCMVVPV